MRTCERNFHSGKPGKIQELFPDRIYRRRRVREPGDLEELLEKTKASEADVRVRDEIV